jgi:hypothetical protein
VIRPAVVRRRAAGLAACLYAATLVGLIAAPSAAAAPVQPGTLTINATPAIAGVQFDVDGVVAASDANGTARLPVRDFNGVEKRLKVIPTQISADLKVQLDRVIGTAGPRRGSLSVGLKVQRLVSFHFVGPDQEPVEPGRVSRIVFRGSTGETVTIEDRSKMSEPLWLPASRTQQTPLGRLVSKDSYWTVSEVALNGAQVVNRGQQKFVPNELRSWTVRLLFYQVSVSGHDALFGSATGEGLELQRADGTVERIPFVDGGAQLANLPRGDYGLRVYGSGLAFVRPVGISKDQALELEVITALDLAIIGSGVGFVAVGLIVVGRRRTVRALGRRLSISRVRSLLPATRHASARAAKLLAIGVVLAPAAFGPSNKGGAALVAHAERETSQEAPARLAAPPAPLLAYYYIWYNRSSWERAKQDYPLLGRYSSADPDVMRRHIDMAAAAGLTGFLVSWKHTEFLDPRLSQLVELAREKQFKLGIVYQGLDFQRNPLPVATIKEDLRFFASQYAADPVFDVLGRPVVVITGTDRFTEDQLREITEPVRSRLQILCSAKTVAEYERVAELVDGDAYYWSSGDPDRPSFEGKLVGMGDAVRARGGTWIAPAPAGFDARDLDGHRVIPRDDGSTLRKGVEAARSSAPAAVGIISWNEFSENSHIEPSERYGTRALEEVARLTGVRLDLGGIAMDSSEPTAQGSGLPAWAAITAAAALIVLFTIGVRLRARRSARSPGASGDGDRSGQEPEEIGGAEGRRG